MKACIASKWSLTTVYEFSGWTDHFQNFRFLAPMNRELHFFKRRFSFISEADIDVKPNQRTFSESSTPRLSKMAFGIGLPCLIRRWHRLQMLKDQPQHVNTYARRSISSPRRITWITAPTALQYRHFSSLISIFSISFIIFPIFLMTVWNSGGRYLSKGAFVVWFRDIDHFSIWPADLLKISTTSVDLTLSPSRRGRSAQGWLDPSMGD